MFPAWDQSGEKARRVGEVREREKRDEPAESSPTLETLDGQRDGVERRGGDVDPRERNKDSGARAKAEHPEEGKERG